VDLLDIKDGAYEYVYDDGMRQSLFKRPSFCVCVYVSVSVRGTECVSVFV